MTTSPELDRHISAGVNDLAAIQSSWLRAYLVALVYGIGLAIVLLAASPLANQKQYQAFFWTIAAIGTVVLLYLMYRSSTFAGKLQQTFSTWQRKTCKLISEDFSLQQNSYISDSDFSASNTYLSYYNIYRGWNLVNTPSLSFSSLLVQHQYTETYQEEETDINGERRTVTKTRTVTDTIFNGSIIKIKLKQNCPACVVLKPHGLTLSNNFSIVRVASPNLRNMFQISANDQFTAHKVLCPRRQAKIEDTVRPMRDYPRISFRGDVAYILFPGLHFDLGDPPGKLTKITTSRLKKIAESIQSSISYVQRVSREIVD